MLHGEEIPEDSVYPGFEEKWGRSAEERVGLPLPANAMKRLVEKIIKGITYLESERYLGDTADIEHHVIREADVSQIRELLYRHGERHSRSPGIEVVRAVAPEDGVSAIYRIEIWGRFVMYASVIERVTQQ